jgi:hypothetical protein
MPDPAYRPLPVEIQNITSDWLTAALQGYAPGIEVRRVDIVDMMRSTCTKIRLKLELANNPAERPIPDILILKGGFEPHSRQMDYMHEKEANAYGKLLPELGLHTPTPYFADFDAESKQGIVIMEDLAKRGVTFCNPLVPHGTVPISSRVANGNGSTISRAIACAISAAISSPRCGSALSALRAARRRPCGFTIWPG